MGNLPALAMSRGLTILSIGIITARVYTAIKIPHPVCPVVNSHTATGTKTSTGPTCITTRKNVSAASPTANGMPAGHRRGDRDRDRPAGGVPAGRERRRRASCGAHRRRDLSLRAPRSAARSARRSAGRRSGDPGWRRSGPAARACANSDTRRSHTCRPARRTRTRRCRTSIDALADVPRRAAGDRGDAERPAAIDNRENSASVPSGEYWAASRFSAAPEATCDRARRAGGDVGDVETGRARRGRARRGRRRSCRRATATARCSRRRAPTAGRSDGPRFHRRS